MELGSDLTVAGQTAPGSGITIAGAKVSMSHGHNIIIRYVRFRGGIAESPKVSSLNLSDAAHVMLDHLSIQCADVDDLRDVKVEGKTVARADRDRTGDPWLA